ncbi:MAG: CoA transferase [Caulobacterales bacterium]
MSAPRALDGVRVLDLSRVLAGPWATQILADLGAEVIKIEKPGAGDDTRGWGPPFLTTPDGAKTDAAYFLAANRNKQSVTVDFTTPAGGDLLRRMVAHCQIFVGWPMEYLYAIAAIVGTLAIRRWLAIIRWTGSSMSVLS